MTMDFLLNLWLFLCAAGGSMLPSFHIGMLGMLGSFQFLFSANYGQMDGLVDDGTDAFRMTRIKAFLVPALILL